jgi:ribosomal protein S8
MNATVKTGKITCEVPANKLAINLLRLLRDQGFIWGFRFVSPEKRRHRLYPRVKIYFKFIDLNTPVLRALRVFPKTRSNYHLIHNKQLFTILVQHKLYILSTTTGLVMTSLDNLLKEKTISSKTRFAGKLLAEVFI